jgi:hypothetical protein
MHRTRTEHVYRGGRRAGVDSLHVWREISSGGLLFEYHGSTNYRYIGIRQLKKKNAGKAKKTHSLTSRLVVLLLDLTRTLDVFRW